MSEFFVGQKVVCVDGYGPLITGNDYVIRAIYRGVGGNTFFAIRGIMEDIPLPGYLPHRFRPLESKSIEVFRKIARDVTEGNKVRIGA